MNPMEANSIEFDLSRNDKLYGLSIPRYSVKNSTVLYEFHLKDLVASKEYVYFFRFK